MERNIILDENDFRTLIHGGVVTIEMTKLKLNLGLQDIGYLQMLHIIANAEWRRNDANNQDPSIAGK